MNFINPYIFRFGDSNFGLTWYAIGYLVGAGLALLLASWRAYKDGYTKDFFVNLFFWAFPMGIVGGRLWFLIAQGDPNMWAQAFNLTTGGMAIQGGALFGIVTGIVFVKVRRKGVPLFQAADWAVPTILVAQMIGRLGNFANAEVHGNIVSTAAYSFMPGFVINQMGYKDLISAVNSGLGTATRLPADQMYVPLFWIEGMINLAGYFFLTHGLEKVLSKHRLYGDETFGYILWYGMTRVLLEPLRAGEYNMTGGGVMQALVMAWVFVGVGVLGILLNHVFTALDASQKLKLNAKFKGFFLNGAPYGTPKEAEARK